MMKKRKCKKTTNFQKNQVKFIFRDKDATNLIITAMNFEEIKSEKMMEEVSITIESSVEKELEKENFSEYENIKNKVTLF